MCKSHEVPSMDVSDDEKKDAACVIARVQGILAYTEIGGGGCTQITIDINRHGQNWSLIFGDANDYWGANFNEAGDGPMDWVYESTTLQSWNHDPILLSQSIREAHDSFLRHLDLLVEHYENEITSSGGELNCPDWFQVRAKWSNGTCENTTSDPDLICEIYNIFNDDDSSFEQIKLKALINHLSTFLTKE